MEFKQIEAESLEEFIELVAKDCIEEMEDEDKSIILENPDPLYHHFGLGMYIRNRYLWQRDSSKDRDYTIRMYRPDDMSMMITERIIQELQKGN